ncbi:aldo/keto reductase [Frankia sp. Cr1]|uniref:aldo/keto reductase n=1 Tax=Frankia sp. Cr1 TaxID=3073931 RepID=UPI003A0FE94F
MRRGDTRIVLGLYRSSHAREFLEAALNLGVRSLDTGYNYLGFTSHRTLACIANDLLSEFTVSTKVGFFPGFRRTEHSLDPGRLSDAIEKSVEDLADTPEVVFLHNPERSLIGLSPDAGRDRLTAACVVLDEAVTTGLCRSWGIASWDTRSLLRVLDRFSTDMIPIPGALMMRVGLLAESNVLDASEQICVRFGLGVDTRWGMNPFGGSTTNPIWDTVNTRIFLTPGQECLRVQAAFRVAYDLPHVGRIAVSTSSVDHLRDLINATALDIDEAIITRYRQLLRTKSVTNGDRRLA